LVVEKNYQATRDPIPKNTIKASTPREYVLNKPPKNSKKDSKSPKSPRLIINKKT